MTRSVPEWIGKTSDTRVPDRVRVRVFESYGGLCYLSGREIRAGDAWEIDHIVALVNGGENRENNLAPVLASEHRSKTRQDVKAKAKGARVRQKYLGLGGPRLPMPGARKSKWKKPLNGPAVRR